MSDQFKLSAAALISTFTLLALHPSEFSSIGFVAAASLLAFALYLERKEHSDLSQLQDQVKALQEKINVIMIGKGMGR